MGKAERAREDQARRNVLSRSSRHVRDVPVQEPPVSGERIQGMPAPRSKYRKAPMPMTRAERQGVAKAQASREAWESTPEGKARTQGVQDLLGDAWRDVPTAQAYMLRGYGQTGTGPKHYDVQLPGMSDPNAAPRPPRWEELPHEVRAHTERSLKQHGTSVDRMVQDYGAQVDQAYVRADRTNQGDTSRLPYGADFYSTGEPRRRIDQTSAELGIPQPVHAAMNAFTSPNTKFSQHVNVRDDAGKSVLDDAGKPVKATVYPNDEAARHAVEWAKAGKDPAAITNAVPGRTKGVQGYTSNLRKAARSMKQWLGGVAPADWSSERGGSPWASSPKTGPYANSWSDSHPQFFVSDVHSGGGGMLPHLSSEKPIKRDASGTAVIQPQYRGRDPETLTEKHAVREKSQREQAIDQVPFFHSASDYAARTAHIQRGLPSTREGQGAQWGEEQLQREMRGGPREHNVYPTEPSRSSAWDPTPHLSDQFKSRKPEVPGQQSLF